MVDIFQTDAFSDVTLTLGINRLKRQYGTLQAMGIFREEGVPTTSVAIEEQGDVLNLLPTRPRGSEPVQNQTGKRKVHQVAIPHNPLQDTVVPADIQGVRAFASETQLDTASRKIVMKLASQRRKHEITREFRQWKALEGLIIDADGDTLLDLYALLGKTRKAVDFVLGTASTNVNDKIEEILDHMDDEAEGETIDGAVAFCGATFWSKLINHDKVKRAFDNWNSRSNMLGEDLRRGFPFGGVTWVKHIGKATWVQADGTTATRLFVPAADALVIPRGTNDTFLAYNAPGDFMDTVNTDGLPFYARSEERKFGKGVDLYTESNHMPIVTRPQLVVRAHTSN